MKDNFFFILCIFLKQTACQARSDSYTLAFACLCAYMYQMNILSCTTWYLIVRFSCHVDDQGLGKISFNNLQLPHFLRFSLDSMSDATNVSGMVRVWACLYDSRITNENNITTDPNVSSISRGFVSSYRTFCAKKRTWFLLNSLVYSLVRFQSLSNWFTNNTVTVGYLWWCWNDFKMQRQLRKR